MMRDLRAPRRPVVWDVVAPEVELVPDALLGEESGEAAGRLERARRVLPLPLTADEDQGDAASQPVEVVAAEVDDVVHRVREVDGVAAPAPAAGRDVVDAAQADGEREEVGPLEGEVRGVGRAEARAGEDALAGRSGAGGDTQG